MNEPLPSPAFINRRGDRDVPLEAIVPIEPPVRARSAFVPEERVVSPALAPQWYSAAPPIKTYVVPKRFGLIAILALTTLMAIVFGVLRYYEASPVWFLFLGTLALTICVVQMIYGAVPRQASIAVGAILSPVFLIVEGVDRGMAPHAVVVGAVAGVVGGAFIGYLVGTCAAGIFLLIENLEPFLPGRRSLPYRGHPLGEHSGAPHDRPTSEK